MTEDINFNVNLIELVGENPLLYDLFHEDYKNLSKTAQVWKKISSELGESVNSCQTRWRTLRSAYVKKHKKAQADKPNANFSINSWRYTNQMSFLDDFIAHKDTGTTLAENIIASSKRNSSSSKKRSIQDHDKDYDEESNNDESLVSLTATEPPRTRKRKKILEDTAEEQAEFVQLLQENRKQMEEIMFERNLDRFDHFGNFIAAHLKTKPTEIADFLMKEITNLLLSDINIEISMK